MGNFLSRRRPTPGTVLGVVALVVAVAGSALADPLATTSVLNKKEKKQTRNIAQSEIAKAAPNLSVKNAQTAANATNAANAANATNAANADLVDGRNAICPAATFLQGGTCFDTAGRGDSDWTGAATTCADSGGYMPSPSELLSIRNVAGIDLGPPGDGSWADARYQDAGINEAMTVVDNGTLEGVLLAGPRDFRCAFNLVR